VTASSDGNSNTTCESCENIYGTSGPISLSDPVQIPDGSDAPMLIQAARAEGFEVHDTLNCNNLKGFTNLRSTVKNGERVGAAQAFLSPVAKYKNLHIIRNTAIEKILLEKVSCSSSSDSDSHSRSSGSRSLEARVKGIRVRTNNPNCPTFDIKAKREVILTAGTTNSPRILLRSGIGKKCDLEPFGIEQMLNLPVGRSYRDKVYSLSYIAVPSNGETYRDPLQDFLEFRNGSLAGLSSDEPTAFLSTNHKHSKYPNIQWSTKIYNVGAYDGALIADIYDYKPELFEKLTELNADHKLIEIKTYLLKPKSTGRVGLRDTDPSGAPFIEGEFLTEECDEEVMVDGLKMVKEFAESNYFQSLNAELVHMPISECDNLEFGCEKYWKCYLKYFAFPGKAGSRKAVVNKHLKVIGIQGKPNLRVADFSIFPSHASGDLQCPNYIVAYKAASMIIGDTKH
jgi:choline dehydrogenase